MVVASNWAGGMLILATLIIALGQSNFVLSSRPAEHGLSSASNNSFKPRPLRGSAAMVMCTTHAVPRSGPA
jgi:hypothetical protein